MPKTATLWKPAESGTSAPSNAGYAYLLESGDLYLTESGFYYLLEDSVVSIKRPTDWNDTAKSKAKWKMDSGTGGFSAAANTRITQASDTRITETGDTRTSETSTYTDKSPTRWAAN